MSPLARKNPFLCVRNAHGLVHIAIFEMGCSWVKDNRLDSKLAYAAYFQDEVNFDRLVQCHDFQEAGIISCLVVWDRTPLPW